MYNSSVPFTPEEIVEIEKAGLTLEQVRDFYGRFPDQNLDTAISGCLQEIAHVKEGDTIPLESSMQETATPSDSEQKV